MEARSCERSARLGSRRPTALDQFLRGALLDIIVPPVLLNESRPAAPVNEHGGSHCSSGLDVKNVQPGLLTTSASLACLPAILPLGVPNASSRYSMRPHTESVERARRSALLPPFRRMPDPDDPTAQIMGEIQQQGRRPYQAAATGGESACRCGCRRTTSRASTSRRMSSSRCSVLISVRCHW